MRESKREGEGRGKEGRDGRKGKNIPAPPLAEA